MTDKQTFIIRNDLIRTNALRAITQAPEGYIVDIREPTRSLMQNKRLWAMLRDIADAQPEGRQWTPETWKCAFLHALGHQVRFAEGLDGSGPFPIGFSSSKLTVKEMGDLITCISEYGDRHGVEWKGVERTGWAA